MSLLAWAALAFSASLAAAWLAARVATAPLRTLAATSPGTPWVERARLAFPARSASRFALVMLPVVYAVFVSAQTDGLPGSHPVLAELLIATSALAGPLLVRVSVERTVRGATVRVRQVLRGWLALWTVAVPHLVVTLAAMFVEHDALDVRSCIAIVAAAATALAAMGGGGLAVARLLGLARPASERLRRAVEAAAAATGVRPRAVYEVDIPVANAFALPAARTLAFTSEALATLDDAQIAAIARHELGHVGEPARVVAARAVNAVVLVTLIAAARPLSGELTDEPLTRVLAAMVMILLAFAVQVTLLRPFARRMEERADAIARGHDAHDGEYARALEALYAANLMPAVTHVRGTHPHLYDRLVAAGAPPAWPRPAPPSRPRLRAAMLVCIGVTAVALAAAAQLAGIALPFFS